jgi:hypothetical protein
MQNKMVLEEYHGKVLLNSRYTFCYLFEVNVSEFTGAL